MHEVRGQRGREGDLVPTPPGQEGKKGAARGCDSVHQATGSEQLSSSRGEGGFGDKWAGTGKDHASPADSNPSPPAAFLAAGQESALGRAR